jgi:Na+-translocating ferredoxin:NAD+ oxidoreductase subunit D
MAEGSLQVSPGPHLWRGLSVSKIMYIVVIALLPPTGAAIYFFGYRALLVIITSIVVCLLTEFLVKKLRGKPFIMDGSALVTGLILALTLPTTISLWMVALGAIFAIAIVKEAFGGLGYNIFNPALAARAFMTASFGLSMTAWTKPAGWAADAIASATPLSKSIPWQGDYLSLFLGTDRAGSLGETSIIMILIGAAILISLKIIDWRIPAAYVGTVALLSLALGKDTGLYVLGGGLMLGAVYMATDYVTTPITHKGRIIFGVGCGIVTIIIRAIGGLPEGVCYSILLMNAVTPLIDRYVRTRPLGLVKVAKSKAG